MADPERDGAYCSNCLSTEDEAGAINQYQLCASCFARFRDYYPPIEATLPEGAPE